MDSDAVAYDFTIIHELIWTLDLAVYPGTRYLDPRSGTLDLGYTVKYGLCSTVYYTVSLVQTPIFTTPDWGQPVRTAVYVYR